MKYFGAILLFAVCVGGEAPANGYQGRLARSDAAPYEPAGFRPSIPFTLPSRQQQQPNYLPPPDFSAQGSNNRRSQFDGATRQYGAPPQTYGTPEIEFSPVQQRFNPRAQQQYLPPQQFYGSPSQGQYRSNQQQQQQYAPPQQSYGSPWQGQYNPQQQPQQYRPDQQYTPPVESYGPPESEYGPPEEATEPESEITTTEVPTTTESTTEFEGEQLKDEENVADDVDKQMGIYYIYHPSGVLQKILFATKNDLKNMAYTAQFKYEDVEPIRDPIFTYDPETFQLRRLST